jgi:hypothetical protein
MKSLEENGDGGGERGGELDDVADWKRGKADWRMGGYGDRRSRALLSCVLRGLGGLVRRCEGV